MKTSEKIAPSSAESIRLQTADAIRAWHRGESLTAEQHDLIEDARRVCLRRAHGVEV